MYTCIFTKFISAVDGLFFLFWISCPDPVCSFVLAHADGLRPLFNVTISADNARILPVAVNSENLLIVNEIVCSNRKKGSLYTLKITSLIHYEPLKNTHVIKMHYFQQGLLVFVLPYIIHGL